MKFIFTFLLISPFITTGQKNSRGYAYVQPSFFIKKGWQNAASLNVGVGFMPNNVLGFGASFDAYIFKKNVPFIVAKSDIRGFIGGKDKPVSIFISTQPGYVVYNKRIRVNNVSVSSKGGFATDILFGVYGISPGKKSIGITMSAGYSLLTFTTNQVSTHYHGFKFSGGLAF